MIEQELKRRANPGNYASFKEWTKANKWLIVLLPVYLVFGLIAGILSLLAKLTGFTYKEMNIFVYYFVIPISWCIMIDHSILGYNRIPISSENVTWADASSRTKFTTTSTNINYTKRISFI